MASKKLYRSKKDRILFGVCGGLAEYLGIDSTLIRILAVILLFSSPWFMIFYVLLGIVIPENPGQKESKAAIPFKDSYLVLGLSLALIGTLLLLINYGWINWSDIWPIILILLGVFLLWQNRTEKK